MSEPYRVADYIADFIVGIGVRHVFLLPGGGNMHLVDGVGKHPKLKVVACLHEQAAAISAEAYGRVTENIGMVMVTTGPGATNAVTAVAGAWIESVPLMIISGQVKRADMLRDAPLRQMGVQEVDILSMVRGVTKYAVTVERPEDVRAVMERGYHLARDGRAGPVWIDVPLDVQGAQVDPSQLQGWLPTEEPAGPSDLGAQLDHVLSLLKASSRPLILAGHGVRLSGAAETFAKLVDTLGIPVVMTWNAMDLLPDDHPLNVGRPGVVALRAPNFAVQNCDLLISIGCRLDNIITAYNPRGFARAAKKVVVDVDHNEIDKLDMEIEQKIVCNAGDFLRQLESRRPESRAAQCKDWVSRCQDWKRRYPVNEGHAFPPSGEISHYHFIDALSRAVPPDTLVSTGSSGLAVEVFYSTFRNKRGQRIFLTSGLGAMGYGLPAAIGACFAQGMKPMVAIESDGSLQLNIQELATMRAFNLPICLMIMNNGGYCSIRNTQRNYFKGRYVGTGPEAGLFLPDLEKVASTYGLDFVRISDASELEAGVARALARPRPSIIDIRLVENEILQPKSAAIPLKDGGMQSMPLEDMSPLLDMKILESEMLIPLLEASITARKH